MLHTLDNNVEPPKICVEMEVLMLADIATIKAYCRA